MRISALSVALILMAGTGVAVADDLEDAMAALKQAESSKDPAKIKQLAAAVHAAAQKMQAPPADNSDKEGFEARAAYAKEQDTYSEYALFALASQLRGQPAAPDLISTLEKQNPKSKYLDEPESLEIQTESALSRKQNDRALSFANRLIAAGNRKPEGAAGDWEARKNAALAQGYWTAGVIQADKGLLKDADRNLRAALPLIKGNNAMAGPALFYLGIVNYKIGQATLNKAKMLEAVKFSQDAAAIPGPQQEQASKNAYNIKTEADKMR
jgi:hypothetical protein